MFWHSSRTVTKTDPVSNEHSIWLDISPKIQMASKYNKKLLVFENASQNRKEIPLGSKETIQVLIQMWRNHTGCWKDGIGYGTAVLENSPQRVNHRLALPSVHFTPREIISTPKCVLNVHRNVIHSKYNVDKCPSPGKWFFPHSEIKRSGNCCVLHG